MCRQSDTVCLIKSPVLDGVAGLPLVERLQVLPDPRRRRGVRHPFLAALLVAASAAVAGAQSFAAIGQWAANAPQHTLARLGLAWPTHSACGSPQAPQRSAGSSVWPARARSATNPGGLRTGRAVPGRNGPPRCWVLRPLYWGDSPREHPLRQLSPAASASRHFRYRRSTAKAGEASASRRLPRRDTVRT
ncbi:transposase family protein [Streptacidiphilus sp. EB103A]|uniref:transposase family protein n=1 Tax=Streptacidiphilus sp. EB103A TaxID=3156275 RepID=UPI0035160E50